MSELVNVQGEPDPDPIDALIEQVARRRQPDVPLYITAAKVYREGIDTLDPVTVPLRVPTAVKTLFTVTSFSQECR